MVLRGGNVEKNSNRFSGAEILLQKGELGAWTREKATREVVEAGAFGLNGGGRSEEGRKTFQDRSQSCSEGEPGNKRRWNCLYLDGEEGTVDFGFSWRQLGEEVSPLHCASSGLDTTRLFKTLPRATYVSITLPAGFSLAEKAAFEDRDEHHTWMLLERGLSFRSQREITESWRTGEYLGFATKYKPVARKVKPVN
ncbi:hypothetical protein PSTG_11756 [Puccinia striiformis f. sp. tritici PST-78]|uniref:Uncharacterized protein n=1 Tax=Puccinia striiformis f. sp. tritici PST-78 TaxID=1165861 RepID=A0A0L0V6N5_9BASI|nr:hypothetical protein PSTG_11756 [Puccinia striiformis f. sp. tritici PST-78]